MEMHVFKKNWHTRNNHVSAEWWLVWRIKVQQKYCYMATYT